MSDPRDDLAALITQALAAVKRPGTASILLDVADAIIAAGWTPPPPPIPPHEHQWGEETLEPWSNVITRRCSAGCEDHRLLLGEPWPTTDNR